MAQQILTQHQGMREVIDEHRLALESHFSAIANILELAGAKDPITEMVLNPVPHARTAIFTLRWKRED